MGQTPGALFTPCVAPGNKTLWVKIQEDDLRVLQHFDSDGLFLLGTVARHGQQVVDVIEDFALMDAQTH